MSLGKIIRIKKNSIADELQLCPGDAIVSVNGQKLKDIIDLSFAFAEEDIDLLIQHSDGTEEMYSFSKEYDDELGAEFESAVFDGIRSCANHCCFCFVDQVPPNMRDSLYIKDDDYRLSFLYGNFITMTNMGAADFDRIARYHLSPMFVSVQSMNMKRRAEMLNTPLAAKLPEQLERLEKADVEYHTQVVLCPGLNDEADLDNTIKQLLTHRPYMQSIAIVPVGLTSFRDGCYPLKLFDKKGAQKVIEQVEQWQQKSRKENGETLIYLSDEFYLLAEKPIPLTEYYDGFPQLDNGIGLARNFIDEWKHAVEGAADTKLATPLRLLVVCGTSIATVFKELLNSMSFHNLDVQLLPVANDYYGHTVNVSGLLTGRDIKNAVQKMLMSNSYDGLIVPHSAIREGEDIFLDDMTLKELSNALSLPVRTALGGAELYDLLVNWKADMTLENEEQFYTWQSNAAYTQLKEG